MDREEVDSRVEGEVECTDKFQMKSEFPLLTMLEIMASPLEKFCSMIVDGTHDDLMCTMIFDLKRRTTSSMHKCSS